MESSESSILDTFKSKKVLSSNSKSEPSQPTHHQIGKQALDQHPWSSKTPEKHTNPPRRTRNRGSALSVKEIREAAQKLRKPLQTSLAKPESPINSTEQEISLAAAKSKKSSVSLKLPEKYEILEKFFNSLDSSIRLLRLKGSATTFTNISPKIECLTDRRFTYNHLAQLMFIIPEVIETKKILVKDERTSCMRPDLQITLNASAVDNMGDMKANTGNMVMRKVFRARLLDFLKAHPEGDDIPERTLPEPFIQPKHGTCTVSSKASRLSLSEGTPSLPLSKGLPAAASHVPHSFKRQFSRLAPCHEVGKTEHEQSAKCTTDTSQSKHCFSRDVSENKSSLFLSPFEQAFNSSGKNSVSDKAILTQIQPSIPSASPVKNSDATKHEECSSRKAEETPSKAASTPAKLMTATPVLRPPKRCYMSPDDSSAESPCKLVRRRSRSKSLKFDKPEKAADINNELGEDGMLHRDDDVLDILPNNLLESIKEKERKALEEHDPAISQAKWRRRMIASLPKLFDMIYFLFHSIKRSVITKEEFMHRIIASNPDITDRREIEEQLTLLQELAPEWICEKFASTSGDLLLCVQKISSPESIRRRLSEAK